MELIKTQRAGTHLNTLINTGGAVRATSAAIVLIVAACSLSLRLLVKLPRRRVKRASASSLPASIGLAAGFSVPLISVTSLIKLAGGEVREGAGEGCNTPQKGKAV